MTRTESNSATVRFGLAPPAGSSQTLIESIREICFPTTQDQTERAIEWLTENVRYVDDLS